MGPGRTECVAVWRALQEKMLAAFRCDFIVDSRMKPAEFLKRSFLIVAFLAAPLALRAKEALPLQIGAAEIDITPPAGFRMAGYFNERLSTGTHDPLKAKA